MARINRGIDKEQEVKGNDDWRDARSTGQKFKDKLETPEGSMLMGIFVLGAMWIYPLTKELTFVFGMLIFYWISKRKFTLPFRLPATSGLLDPNDPKPGTDSEPGKAAGVAFLGNEAKTRKELWLSASDMKTHLLVFGSTGAGKALKMDELVHTPEGWRINQELKIGDRVSRPNGESTEIIGVYPQGEKELMSVIFEDGRHIEVSPDHLWEVKSGGLDSIDNNIAGDVISTLEVQNRILKGDRELWVPMTKPIDVKEAKIPANIEKLALIAATSLETGEHVPYINKIGIGSIKQRELFISLFLENIKDKKEHYIHINNETSLYIKNDKFASELQFILRSLGYFAILEKSNDGLSVITFKKQDYLIISMVHRTNERAECQCIKVAARDGLFVTRDWIVTHNTETLISLAFNSLVQGSGFIYVDGKGDNSLWAKIFSIARSVGREDDVLVLNYMTGGRDVFGPQTSKLSNTLNPFISGSAGGLTELLVGLMDEAGGDNAMWKGRAISLVSGIMMALVWMRDNDGLLLDVDQIRKYLILDEIQDLVKRRDLPLNISEAIKSYLVSLPGYNPNSPTGKQSETVNDQHGYLQMQFTKILGSLSDTYGYIFRTNLGEIDFFDVVVNRRILVVLLPALEKSIDELSNLGKIVVACIKSMMATGLGDTLEGDYSDVIETKPTNALAPYMCILDEYGYYVVKGAAVMPAQARSLGFSMVFAGQDYPAFKKNNNAEEAVSTIGNCNIKIFMKVEDPTDTYELFKQSVGEALVQKSGGKEISEGILGGSYMDTKNINYERRGRGDLLDLKDQREGEAHIIFKSALVRAKMFYAAPANVKKLQLNHFLRVEPPSKKEINAFEYTSKELKNKLLNNEFMSQIGDLSEEIPEISSTVKLWDNLINSKKTPKEAAAGVLAYMADNTYDGFKDFANKMSDFAISEEDEKIDVFREELNDDEDMSFEQYTEKNYTPDIDEEDDEDEDRTPIFINKQKTHDNFVEIEKASGSSDEEARIKASQAIEDMQKASEYPRSPVPEQEDSTKNIMDIIESLGEELDNEEDHR